MALSVVSGEIDADQTTEQYPVTEGISVTSVDRKTALKLPSSTTISMTNTPIQTTGKYTNTRSVSITNTFTTKSTLTPDNTTAKQDNQKYTGFPESSQVNILSSTPKAASITSMSSQINTTISTRKATITISPKASASSATKTFIEVASYTTKQSSATPTRVPETTLSGVSKSHKTTTLNTTTTKILSIEQLPTEEQTGIYVENVTNLGRLRYTYDEFDAGDKLWPVGMALTIGLPTIIVLAVTITVLYKRQVAKPRSRMSFYGQNYAQM